MNVLAALAAPGPDDDEDAPPPLTWWAAGRTWKGEDLVAFLQHALPPDRGLPRVVVMDNASHHRGRKVREARADLLKQKSPFVLFAALQPGTERH